MSQAAQRLRVATSLPLLAALALAPLLACGLSDGQDSQIWQPSPTVDGESTATYSQGSAATDLNGSQGSASTNGSGGSYSPISDYTAGSYSDSTYGTTSSGAASNGSSTTSTDSSSPYGVVINNGTTGTTDTTGTSASSTSASSSQDTELESSQSSYMVKVNNLEATLSGWLVCELWDTRIVALSLGLVTRFIAKLVGVLARVPKLIRLISMGASLGAIFSELGCDIYAAAAIDGHISDRFVPIATDPILLKDLSRANLVGKELRIEIYDKDDYNYFGAPSLDFLNNNVALGACRGTVTDAALDKNTMVLDCSYDGNDLDQSTATRLSTLVKEGVEQSTQTTLSKPPFISGTTASITIAFK